MNVQLLFFAREVDFCPLHEDLLSTVVQRGKTTEENKSAKRGKSIKIKRVQEGRRGYWEYFSDFCLLTDLREGAGHAWESRRAAKSGRLDMAVLKRAG